ncbi:hypothetical protein [Ruegeria sp. EL01]|jgi:transposase|uniref:hypothetical protein n=1 Tax=Ruegeria sp. EL01 TaxID=2107578 RepID=UPI001C1FA7DE|nr:hypothetical protein [Ruegeria sp. EL01]
MLAPLPDARRARFQRFIEEGLSGRAAALRLKLSPATGARWGLAIRRLGHARAAPKGRPRGKGKLDPHRAFLMELIDQDGDMTMPELAGVLADATGVQAHPDAIGRSCASWALRKKTLVATERHRAWQAGESFSRNAAARLALPRYTSEIAHEVQMAKVLTQSIFPKRMNHI